MQTKLKKYLPEILGCSIAIPLIVRLFRLCTDSAADFEVYWYAIHAWVAGNPPYAQYSTVWPGMVFKYPPWILPLFLPFAWLDLDLSKWIWTAAQVAMIFYAVVWLVRRGVHRWVVFLVTLSFWWMFLAHAYFGQVSLFLLAAALFACEKTRDPFQSTFRLPFLAYLLTTKIFFMIALVGVPKLLTRVRSILVGVEILVVSHLVLFAFHPKLSFATFGNLVAELYRDWMRAAASGGEQLGELVVRGQQNHGLVAAISRICGISATNVRSDIIISLILCVLFGSLWFHFSKKLKFEERWVGWIAMGVVVHPLAWHHSFVMAFPLCAFSLDKAVQCKKKSIVLLSFLGTACIGLFIPQVIGVDAVIPLEYVASKSWGVIFAAIALVLAEQRIKARHR